MFGDGDPNQDYEEGRWRALGQYIQRRNGVVTAEEMAPFLDPPVPDAASVSGSSGIETDDSFVLPALVKFGGEPFVDDAGHLLYRFPSFQRTVIQRVRAQAGRQSVALLVRSVKRDNDMVQKAARYKCVVQGSLSWDSLTGSVPGRCAQEELGGRGSVRLTRPEPQYEHEWKQTAASSGQMVAITALGILNVAGVVWLGSLLVSG